jgi:3-hydroxyacyl-CoA dehydrogenase
MTRRVAVIGAGTIGASWAAIFLARGFAVGASDPSPQGESFARRFIDNAWPTLAKLGWVAPGASAKNFSFHATPAAAVEGAEFVQESGPEREDVKIDLFAAIDAVLPPEVVIASSSSGLLISRVIAKCKHPERCVIGHPFNPPHLIPLVEIVGGAKTSEETIRRATEFYRSIGKQTVRLNKEVPGHVANRLQAALAREVYYLVDEGVVSVADVDTALAWGPGLRWGIMGQVMLNHLGGGPGGIEHMLKQFTGPITAWWKVLGSPTLTPELQKKLIDGVHAEAGSRTIDELEAARDEILLGLLELRTKHPQTVAPREAAAE